MDNGKNQGVSVIFDDIWSEQYSLYNEIARYNLNGSNVLLYNLLNYKENNCFIIDEFIAYKFIILDPQKEFINFKLKVFEALNKMNIKSKEINNKIIKCSSYIELCQILLEIYVIGYYVNKNCDILVNKNLEKEGFIVFYNQILMSLNCENESIIEIKYILYLIFFNFTSRLVEYNDTTSLSSSVYLKCDKGCIKLDSLKEGQIILPLNFLFLSKSNEENDDNVIFEIQENQIVKEKYFINFLDLEKVGFNHFEITKENVKNDYILLPYSKLLLKEIDNSKLKNNHLKLTLEHSNSFFKVLYLNFFKYFCHFPILDQVNDSQSLFSTNLIYFKNYIDLLDKNSFNSNKSIILRSKLLDAQCSIYKNYRNYPVVKDLYQRAISLIESISDSNDYLDILTDFYFELTKSLINIYEINTALSCLNKGKEIIAEIFEKDNIISVKFSSLLCWILFNQNKIKECLDLISDLYNLFNNESYSRENILNFADFLKETGVILMSLGYFSKAEIYLVKALKIYEITYDDKSSFDLSVIYFDLGCLYRYKGNTDVALELFVKSKECTDRVYGQNFFDTYHVYEQIGQCYLNYSEKDKYKENFNKAFDIIDSHLKFQEKVVSENKSCLFQFHQLAILYEKIGFMNFNLSNYSDAIINYEKTQEIYKSFPNSENYSINITNQMINIGNAYYSMCNFEKALDVYTKALKPRRKIFEEKSLEIVKLYNKIGNTYFSLKQYELAIKIYEKSLNIYISIFGEEHIYIANQYSNIGNCFYENKQYQKSIDYHEKAYSIRVLLLGNSYDTILSYIRLGDCYYMMKDSKKAFEMYTEGLEICKKVFGNDNYVTLNHLNNLALVYFNSAQYEKAIEFYNEILFTRIKMYGNISEKVADTFNQIGNCYCYLGKLEESLEYYEKSKKTYVILYGENSVELANLINNIANIYIYKGMYPEAEKEHFRALAMRLTILGHDHVDVAHSYSSLGLLYYHLNNLSKSVDFHTKACEIFLKIEGETSVSLAREYKRLASIYFYLGNNTSTLNNYNLCLKSLYKYYGDKESMESSDVYISIALVYKVMIQYRKSLDYYLKALNIRFELYNTEENSGYYSLLLNIAEVYELQKDYCKVLEYYEKYSRIVDKLQVEQEVKTVVQGKIMRLKEKLNKNQI